MGERPPGSSPTRHPLSSPTATRVNQDSDTGTKSELKDVSYVSIAALDDDDDDDEEEYKGRTSSSRAVGDYDL